MISFEPDNAAINKIFQDNFFSLPLKIFSNEEVLSPTYIPEILPHREDPVKHFGSCFKTIVTTGHAKQDFSHLIIQGDTGTGKTTLAKVCMLHLIAIAQKYYVQLRYIHVNCRSAKNVLVMLNTILQTLDPFVPVRGFFPTELLLHLFNMLKHVPFHLVVTFDELDTILESHDPKEFARFLELLTGLYEAPPDVKEKFSLIFILRRFDFLFRLDILKHTLMQRNVIQLSPYSQGQLTDIFQDRVQNVFCPHTAPAWLAPILASLVEYLHLDIRAGLNLLANIGREAESCEAEVITGDHVRAVLFRMYDWESTFADFSLTEQLVLLVVARYLIAHEHQFTLLKTETLTHYVNLCRMHHVKHESKDEFDSILAHMNKHKCLLVYQEHIILCYPVKLLLPKLEQLLNTNSTNTTL